MQANVHISSNHTWEQMGLNTIRKFNDSWVEEWYKNKIVQNKCNDATVRKKIRYEIHDFQCKLKDCINLLNDISACESNLRVNVSTMADPDWQREIAKINKMKIRLDSLLDSFDDATIFRLKKQIKKRLTKRAQLKRRNSEKRLQYQELIKIKKEKSRSIDAMLEEKKKEKQDSIQKEEMERNEECILRNVLKKKSDTRQCLALLNALTKLRNARKSTVTGRGEKLLDEDGPFQTCIEKLEALWTEKKKLYEVEETQLRLSISEKEKNDKHLQGEKKLEECTEKWKDFLFGQGNERFQRDFAGDVQKFLHVRSEWDKYISQSEGSALPIGWIIPQL